MTARELPVEPPIKPADLRPPRSDTRRVLVEETHGDRTERFVVEGPRRGHR